MLRQIEWCYSGMHLQKIRLFYLPDWFVSRPIVGCRVGIDIHIHPQPKGQAFDMCFMTTQENAFFGHGCNKSQIPGPHTIYPDQIPVQLVYTLDVHWQCTLYIHCSGPSVAPVQLNTHQGPSVPCQCTVVKKRKLTARKVRNIFSLLRGVNSFWTHCNMAGVLQNEAELRY